MSQEDKTQTVSTNSEPWTAQQPYLKTGFDKAQGLLDQGPQEYYPGQTVVDTSGQTSAGQFGQFGAAQQNADQNRYTAQGGYLSAGNPQFQQMATQIGQAIRPSIDSAFAANGRYGSGAHADAYASALADKVGTLAYQNYGDERTRQMAAQQDYSPYTAMMGVGSQLEAKQGEYNADAQNRFNFDQNAGQNSLNNYMNIVGNRSYGGTGTTNTPYTSNPAMQGLGTGISALGALGQFASGTKGLLW